jgi:hypothetical protein
MEYKSEQEWIIIRYFRAHFPGFPKGRLSKAESPDFILRTGPKKLIGIEITQIHPAVPNLSYSGHLETQWAVKQVINTIAAKQEKLTLYRAGKFTEIWLIIHADYAEEGATDRLDAIYPLGQPGQGFNRVFLFNLYRHHVTELLSLSAQGCNS